jgi:hypothetical protein
LSFYSSSVVSLNLIAELLGSGTIDKVRIRVLFGVYFTFVLNKESLCNVFV